MELMSTRLLTAGSLVRVQQGEPHLRWAHRSPQVFCKTTRFSGSRPQSLIAMAGGVLILQVTCFMTGNYIVGVDGGEGTPVPIPNTEVKLICAEDTWLETARENR